MDLEAAPSSFNNNNNNNNNNNINGSSSPSKIPAPKRTINWPLLLLCLACSTIGIIGGPMLQRLYYTHGGSRKWFSSFLQTVGFPCLVAPIGYLYLKKLAKKDPEVSLVFFMNTKLVIYGAIIGVLLGFDNYMYSAGLSYLPVSTSALLFSTQLAFTAFFAFVIVKQKFTFYSFNSVVLMSLGAVVLALNTSGDRPPGVNKAKYFLGFFLTLGGAALLGFTMPLIELSYRKSGAAISFSVVMQFQFVLSVTATIVTAIGMVVNNDFKVLPREAREFDLGQGKYYLLIVALVIVWQLFSLGFLGIIYCTTSLFAGIFTTVLLPFTQIAGTIAFNEKFTGQKGMSLALCLWGFTSYFIGEYKKSQKSSLAIVEADQEIDAKDTELREGTR